MSRFLGSTVLAVGALVFVAVAGAHAATVQISNEDYYLQTPGHTDAPLEGTRPADNLPNPPGPTNFTLLVSGSVPSVTRSPYENNSVVLDQGTTYSTLNYGGGPAGNVIYDLGGATSFSILWGSPDPYNFIAFYSGANGGGSLLSSTAASGNVYTGTDTACIQTGKCKDLNGTPIGWDYITFTSSVGIGSVVLSDSGQAAFEFGVGLDSVVRESPLPAAVWMFGTVIAGAAGAARLRRRRKA